MEEKKVKVNITNKVFTTKEMALELGMTGKALRRYLRKMVNYNDGIYTRYSWTKSDYDKVIKAIKTMIDKANAKKEKKEETK